MARTSAMPVAHRRSHGSLLPRWCDAPALDPRPRDTAKLSTGTRPSRLPSLVERATSENVSSSDRYRLARLRRSCRTSPVMRVALLRRTRGKRCAEPVRPMQHRDPPGRMRHRVDVSAACRTIGSTHPPGRPRFTDDLACLEVIRNVITAQTTELADKETAVSILGTRMADTVLLIDALGGVGTRPSCR